MVMLMPIVPPKNILLVGDGSIAFNVQELQQLHLMISHIIFVANNSIPSIRTTLDTFDSTMEFALNWPNLYNISKLAS